MRVRELSRGQLTELKQSYYCNEVREGRGVSYDELADIDNLVTDEEIFEKYSSTDFANDDFVCTAGM